MVEGLDRATDRLDRHQPARRRLQLTTAALVLALAATARAGEPAVTDPAQADADLALQGEYTGTLRGAKTGKHGLQVIARGGGKLRAVLHAGGLPGQARGRTAREEVDGEREGATVRFTGSIWSAVVDGKRAVFTASDGTPAGALDRVERRSPTLGAKPPNGAVVLFDGTGVAAWEEKARATDDGLLMEGATSRQRFGNMRIHVEFRTPYMPASRGQARGNSGVYVQGRYEVQILDSFGLAGRHDEGGGIYSIADPLLNMSFPPLTWQTYDIDFTAAVYRGGKKIRNARATVRHNGVVVHDDLELTHATAANPVPEAAEPGPLYLQDHGDPVRFRNVWVVEKR